MLISIVMRLYNKGPHVDRSILSVLAQTRADWEMIIVDDGSTDDGASRAEVYLDERIRLIRQDNAGVSAARNRGAALARGEYVCFLDADDEWLPEFLERVQALIEMCPDAGMFVCRHQIVDSNGTAILRPLELSDDHVGEVDNFLVQMRRNSWIIQTSSCCCRLAAFHDVGGFPENVQRGEDAFLFIQLARRFRVMFDARVSARYYFQVAGSLSAVNKSLVSYPVAYFLDGNNMPADEPQLRDLVMHKAFISAGFAVSARQRARAWQLALATWFHHKPTALKCGALAVLPNWLMSGILWGRRRIRTRRLARWHVKLPEPRLGK